MTTASDSTSSAQGQPPESLRALAEYLEFSLDKGKSLVMMRHGTGRLNT
jgi:hypothetical protein